MPVHLKSRWAHDRDDQIGDRNEGQLPRQQLDGRATPIDCPRQQNARDEVPPAVEGP
jgi:hypothetical protein